MKIVTTLSPSRMPSTEHLALAIQTLQLARRDAALCASRARRRAARRVSAIRSSACKRGYTDGLASGSQAVTDAISALMSVTADTSASFREHLVEVALRIAEEILGEEIQNGSPGVGARIDKALSNVRPGRPLRIVGNPADEDSLLAWSEKSGVPVEISSGVAPGDVRLTLEDGDLHLSLRQHLRTIESAVRRAWRASCREESNA